MPPITSLLEETSLTSLWASILTIVTSKGTLVTREPWSFKSVIPRSAIAGTQPSAIEIGRHISKIILWQAHCDPRHRHRLKDQEQHLVLAQLVTTRPFQHQGLARHPAGTQLWKVQNHYFLISPYGPPCSSVRPPANSHPLSARFT